MANKSHAFFCYRHYSKEILPQLHMDSGPDFVSLALAECAEEHEVELEFITPGESTQKSPVERFNRPCRDGILNMHLFRSLAKVRETTEKWILEYNTERPQDSLPDMTLEENSLFNQQPEKSSLAWT